MIARALISPSLEKRVEEIQRTLASHIPSGNTNHPDVLYFSSDSKLGIAEARIIKNHFSLRPYSAKGRVVVMEDASVLTLEAQNALLKTLEELPEYALFILGASSDANLLPTVLSRCEIVILSPAKPDEGSLTNVSTSDIESLLQASIEGRFDLIANLKEKEEFLQALVAYFHQDLNVYPRGVKLKFVHELLQAEQWAKQNVNIRAILEYLMLKMPTEK